MGEAPGGAHGTGSGLTENFVVPWPADQIERRPLDELVPYANNAITHPDVQISKICTSMETFGWTNPVLVDESGNIIAGHGRVLAASILRKRHPHKYATVPTMVARGWSDEKKRAYRIADNRLAMDAEWDEGLLRLELADLSTAAFNLSVMGFDRAELKRLTAPDPGDKEPEQVPMERCPKCGSLTRKIKKD